MVTFVIFILLCGWLLHVWVLKMDGLHGAWGCSMKAGGCPVALGCVVRAGLALWSRQKAWDQAAESLLYLSCSTTHSESGMSLRFPR